MHIVQLDIYSCIRQSGHYHNNYGDNNYDLLDDRALVLYFVARKLKYCPIYISNRIY
jgi:hypothetical protein